MLDRRPSPEVQVGESLSIAKRAQFAFDAAWDRSVKGEVCDSYRSARTDDGEAWPEVEPGPPPNLRESSDGQTRCAGCRYRSERTCALFGAPVFPGVLWPHRTEDRQEWKDAIEETREGWRDAYEHTPNKAGKALDMLRRWDEREASTVDMGQVSGGTLAA